MSSGLFFIVLGIIFLVVADRTIGQTHAGMTFILVVVGVAIVLYGTGTQATGTFDGAAPSTTFKLSLAGGAGVLAFATAAGIVKYQKDINQAFREEIRYLNVSIPVVTRGAPYFQNYSYSGFVDGKAVAMMKGDNDTVIAVVPYTLRDSRKMLIIKAEWADPIVQRPDILVSTAESRPIEIPIGKVNSEDIVQADSIMPENNIMLAKESSLDVGTAQVVNVTPDNKIDLENAPPAISITPQ